MRNITNSDYNGHQAIKKGNTSDEKYISCSVKMVNRIEMGRRREVIGDGAWKIGGRLQNESRNYYISVYVNRRY